MKKKDQNLSLKQQKQFLVYGTIFWFGEDEPNTDGKTQDEEETSSSALNKRSFMGTK